MNNILIATMKLIEYMERLKELVGSIEVSWVLWLGLSDTSVISHVSQ